MPLRAHSHLSRLLETGVLLLAGLASLAPAQQSPSPPRPSQSTTQRSNSPAAQPTSPALPRGKKLFLKDGSFQLVREYEIAGDRVRYYSLDSSQWEEIPADLVDWDATKKTETDESRRDAAAIAKVGAQEKARNTELKLDVDASLEVAPGIFLPPGDGLFAYDGKTILPLTQAPTGSNLDKKQVLKQVLVPVPIVPTRHNVSIAGPRARLRLKNGQSEFYMRTADARDPEMELVRTHVHGDTRQIENLDQIYGQSHISRDSISMQKWPVAPGVTRYTLAEPLASGEYVFMEIVQKEESSLYVWDFGIDGEAQRGTTKSK